MKINKFVYYEVEYLGQKYLRDISGNWHAYSSISGHTYQHKPVDVKAEVLEEVFLSTVFPNQE
jgi:hypothetical protein